MNLLLVEDDKSLGVSLKERLDKEGYNTTWVSTLARAETAFGESRFDLVILDVGLPDGSGFEFAKKVREKSTVPFIFVTAQTSAEQRLHGYEIGAEEYIPKPFHLKEFLMRISHVLENHAVEAVVGCGSKQILFQSMSILNEDGTQTRLPLKDFQILKLLIERAPQVVSRDDILNKVWGEEKFPSHRTVDNIILRIRQALGEQGSNCIRSVRGVGYQWAEEVKVDHE